MTYSRLAVVVAFGALAVGAIPARAALGSEVSQGRALAAHLNAGTTSCSKLSNSDFEHLGEYVMERMVGSRSAHQAMNSRMETMMGSATADRMHQALGRRFAGCPAKGSVGMMGGGGVMGSTGGGWGSMMGSGDWSWMRNDSWRHMTSTQWHRAGSTMMGGGWMMSGSGSGWSTAAVTGALILAVALGGLVVLAVVRRPRGDLPQGTVDAG